MSRRLVPLLVLLLAACGGKENVREPSPLQPIAAPVVRASTAWTASIDTGKRFNTLRPVLEPDALLVAGSDGEVAALDPRSGKPLWRRQTGARIASGPSVSGDLVFVGTLDGEVLALKRADGQEQWRSRLSSEVMAPVASDGRMVIARSVDGRLYGLSAADGSRQWVFDRAVPSLTLRGLSEPLLVGSLAYAGLDNGRIVAFDASNGQVAWEQAVAVPSGRTELDRITDIDAALVADGSRICAASFGGEVACFDGETGEGQWRRSVKSYTGFALLGELLVITDEAGVVWGLDAASGAAAWKQEGLKYRQLSPPVAFGGYAVAADFEGYLHWLDPKDGKLVARSRAGSEPVRAPLAASADLLYVLNTEGRISAISARP
jgi:outer membrane protein assembly factor BamB